MTTSEVNLKLNLLNLNSVCRLCSSKSDLVSFFDKKFNFPQTMQTILVTVTTIEVSKEDEISQKICPKCVTTVIHMFQFRDQSIRNDELLRTQYEQLMDTDKLKQRTAKNSNEVDENNVEKGHTDHKKIRTESPAEKIKSQLTVSTEPLTEKKVDKLKVSIEPPEEKRKSKIEVPTRPPEKKTNSKFKDSKPSYKIHSSITALFKQYSNIRVPTVCLNSNIGPRVVLEMDAVEHYFKNKKLNIYKYIQLALNQPRQVAVKHTLSKNQLRIPNRLTTMRNFRKQNKDAIIDLTESKIDNGKSSNRSSDNDTLNRDPLPFRHQIKKRKLLSDTPSSEQSVKKPFTIETSLESSSPSHSRPASFNDDIPNLSVASSQALHICSICSSVHSQACYLKRHMIKHLNCQFCKSKFKTLELKEKHVKSECKVQKIMKSMIDLPDIPLQKIETNAKIRRKFYQAFAPFDLISKIKTEPMESHDKKIKTGEKMPTINVKDKKIDSKTVEILSNEEKTVSNIISATTTKNSPINVDIKIKDSSINLCLLNNPTEIKVIKNLLMQYNKLHRKVNNATQTFLPTNELIKVIQGDLTIEMKSLKQHLFYYKIPIDVKNGSIVNVCYKYDSSNKTSRELKHWNDLILIDVNFNTNERIVNTFDTTNSQKGIKQEIINAADEERTEVEEILIEEIYNLSLPSLQNANDNLRVVDKTDTDSNSEQGTIDSDIIIDLQTTDLVCDGEFTASTDGNQTEIIESDSQQNNTNERIVNTFDTTNSQKEIKQEIINAADEERTEIEEILIEDIYNMSLPPLQNANDNLRVVDKTDTDNNSEQGNIDSDIIIDLQTTDLVCDEEFTASTGRNQTEIIGSDSQQNNPSDTMSNNKHPEISVGNDLNTQNVDEGLTDCGNLQNPRESNDPDAIAKEITRDACQKDNVDNRPIDRLSDTFQQNDSDKQLEINQTNTVIKVSQTSNDAGPTSLSSKDNLGLNQPEIDGSQSVCNKYKTPMDGVAELPMILKQTSDKNVANIQVQNLFSPSNGDTSFLQDDSGKSPSNINGCITVAEEMNSSRDDSMSNDVNTLILHSDESVSGDKSSTSHKNVTIRVKTVCEINE